MNNFRLSGLLVIGVLVVLVTNFCPAQDSQTTNPEIIKIVTMITNTSTGKPVSGLSQDDFVVTVDKEIRPIKFFVSQQEPVSIVILVDMSGSMRSKASIIVNAIAAFSEKCHPDNEYALITYEKEARLNLDWTRERRALAESLKILSNSYGRGTALYDAIDLALRKLQSAKQVKKIIVIVGDSGDRSSMTNREKLYAQLMVSDATLYLIFPEDIPGVYSPGSTEFEQLGKMTGGRAFFPRNRPEFIEALEQIAVELPYLYIIGFERPSLLDSRKPLKIKINVSTGAKRIKKPLVRHREKIYAADSLLQPGVK